MKISIARLKEIIMEEVARATAIEEEDVPGSEEYEAGIEAEKKEKEERRRAAREEEMRQLGLSMANPGPRYDRPAPPTRAQLAARKKRDDERKLRASEEAILRAVEWGSMEESLNIEIVDDE